MLYMSDVLTEATGLPRPFCRIYTIQLGCFTRRHVFRGETWGEAASCAAYC